MDIFGLLVAFGVSVVMLPLAFFVFYEPYTYFYRLYYYKYKCTLEPEDQNFLAAHCTFYAGLDTTNRLRFEKRISFLIKFKKISGIDIEVTHTMQLLILCGITQVTFGLKHFRMGLFDTIYIFKEAYPLTNSNQTAKGHVSGSGKMYLGWKLIEEGYDNPTDGINLAIHEAAHAEIISAIQQGDDLDFACRHDDWLVLANKELIALQTGTDQFFRAYGATNTDEFFAVVLENFFERAEAFKTTLPELFNATCLLLNLDTTCPTNPVLKKDESSHIDIPIAAQPRLSPKGLLDLVIKSPLNIFYFITGTLAWCFVAYVVYAIMGGYMPLNYAVHIGSLISWLCAVAAFVGLCCYVMVFYSDNEGVTDKSK